MDEWPAIRCPRFDGESQDGYRRRQAEFLEIVTNFRRGRYVGAVADKMEARLERLRAPELEYEY